MRQKKGLRKKFTSEAQRVCKLVSEMSHPISKSFIRYGCPLLGRSLHRLVFEQPERLLQLQIFNGRFRRGRRRRLVLVFVSVRLRYRVVIVAGQIVWIDGVSHVRTFHLDRKSTRL